MITIIVQGKPYEFEPSDMASVSLLRSAALQRHGIINYLKHKDLDETWEIRDAEGRVVSPSRFVSELKVDKLYLDPRPGWGG